MKHDNDNFPVQDLLFGAKAIAEFLGINQRQTYRLIYDGIAPSFKLGGTVAARKSTLTKWLASQEQVAA
ncbi:MAG: helix-turn-helix transcriptional regulator [Allorhizobium sp.]